MRTPLISLLCALVLTGACGKTFVPTPQGAMAPPPSAQPYAYANEVTAANGWTPRDSGRYLVDLGELAAFRMMSARRGGLRVLVYYNSALSSQVSAWRTPSREVLELDFDERGAGGARSGRRTLTLSTQVAADQPVAGQDLDALLAHRIEATLTRLLLAVDTRVMDKAMLFRRTAAATGVRTVSEAEIRALEKDVDLLIEVAFIPSSASRDGFEVGVKAVRTKDARLLAWSSSANARESSMVVAEAGRGYTEVDSRQIVSLDARAATALQLALSQVARTY